jgi:hypothetical protein
MSAPSIEPFAISGNGEVVRIGDRVICAAALFTVTGIDRENVLEEVLITLAPIDDRARQLAGRRHGSLDSQLLADADSVRPEGTPVRHI